MRRFTKATGMSPLNYVHALRLEEASNCWREEFYQSRRLPMMSVTRTRASSVACSTARLASRQHNIGGDLVNCAVSCHSLCPTNNLLGTDDGKPLSSRTWNSIEAIANDA